MAGFLVGLLGQVNRFGCSQTALVKQTHEIGRLAPVKLDRGINHDRSGRWHGIRLLYALQLDRRSGGHNRLGSGFARAKPLFEKDLVMSDEATIFPLPDGATPREQAAALAAAAWLMSAPDCGTESPPGMDPTDRETAGEDCGGNTCENSGENSGGYWRMSQNEMCDTR